MKVRLVQQFKNGQRIPREKILPLDDVEIDLDRSIAVAIQNDRIVHKLIRAKVDTISAHGLCISGLEEHFKNGADLYYHQEWWCATGNQ